MVLLGWNPDSVLQAEFSPGLEMVSLFEPMYPKLEQIEGIINSNREAPSLQLKQMFRLTRLLDQSIDRPRITNACMPLQVEKTRMTRGIPEHVLLTLDGMLTNRYKNINAKMTIPPLAIALNESTIITNKTKKDLIIFQG